VITSATPDGTSTTVSETLTDTPNTTFMLEFFASSLGKPAGGEQLLGSLQVTTDAAGDADITVTFDTAVAPGMFLTATATDPGNNTSQFSAGVEVAQAPAPRGPGRLCLLVRCQREGPGPARDGDRRARGPQKLSPSLRRG
jgi:hypothetical protein